MKDFFAALGDFFLKVGELFEVELFKLGESPITLATIFYLLISIIILVWFSGWLKRTLTRRIAKRYDINKGTIASIATIVRYGILILGLIIIVQSAGIDLSAISLLAGALGVGIGFGLQNITNNFISGLIILFEQPIKVGDRVTVGEIEGDVIKIAPRATTVITNENISLIIPNSEFISNTVTNWSHNDRIVALKYPIGVSYESDPQHVKKVLLEVVESVEGILKDPPAEIFFTNYQDSALEFTIWVWTTEYTDRPNRLKSILYYEIFEKFRLEGINIPYPQRDIHIKSGKLPT